MRLFLVRHGATPGNETHAYVGARTDEGLSEAGRAHVASKGSFPQVKWVYVSPMLRACQTAALLFPCAHQHKVADLREMDFGAFEGRSAVQMEHDAAYRAWVDGWCSGQCPQGESRKTFADRVERAVAGVVADARFRGLADVFVVAHGGTVMSALDRFVAVESAAASDPAARAQRYFSWSVPPCEGWVADVALRSSAPASAEGLEPFVLEHPRRIDFAALARGSQA